MKHRSAQREVDIPQHLAERPPRIYLIVLVPKLSFVNMIVSGWNTVVVTIKIYDH